MLDKNGVVKESYDYYPFGLEMPGRSFIEGDIATKEGFTEKERDAETNWHYFGARYYSSALGRWLAVDPLADKYYSYSPYNYTLNNPIFFFDPDGKEVTGFSVRQEKNAIDFLTGKKTKDEYLTQHYAEGAGGAIGALVAGIGSLISHWWLANTATANGLANTAIEFLSEGPGNSISVGLAKQMIGLAREKKVAELVGGVLAKNSKGQDLELLAEGVGKVAIDVIGKAGELITVGGPKKAANLSKLGKHLKILKAVADKHEVKAMAYYETGTPEQVILLAKKNLGEENVKLFTMD